MATTPEGKVKARIDAALKEEGGIFWFNPQAGPFGRSGIPDKLLCVRGHFIGVEAKADHTKKPTELQKQAMKRIEKAGGKCFVVYDAATLKELMVYIHKVKQNARC